MDIRLIALDMDGTLLDSQKRLPSDFIPWVKAHPQIRTVIASGRQYATLRRDFEEIADRLIFIAENGGLVFEHDTAIYSDTMDNADVRACLNRVKSLPGVTPICCGVKGAWMPFSSAEAEHEAELYYRSLERMENVADCTERDAVVKLALYVEGGKAEEVFPYTEGISERIAPVLSGCSWIDVANRGASKGAALAAVQARFAVRRENSMAFGDYLNDRTLLEACGESYCMQNGHPALKAIAKHIAASNDDDGVMKVLRTL